MIGSDLRAQLTLLVMRQFQKLPEKSQLVHHLQRRGVDGVSAKIAQKIFVLFQHHDVDTGASEQKSQHHARRPTAGDAAACMDLLQTGGALRTHWSKPFRETVLERTTVGRTFSMRASSPVPQPGRLVLAPGIP